MKIICYCSNVTEEQIIESIENGARSLSDIKEFKTSKLWVDFRSSDYGWGKSDIGSI